ncbi:MAG: hypothetical protein R3C05_25665 [Pirellulaceae bacterium]
MVFPVTRRHSAFVGHVGIARAEITPPIGIYARNWGASSHDLAESIHRPLTVNALTIAEEDGGPELLLIDADLGWWRPIELFESFRQRLLKDLSLRESQLIFAITHTHSAAPLMKGDAELPGSEMLEPWLGKVYDAIVSSVGEARRQTFAATIDWHTGRCGLAANRDLEDPDDLHRGRRICGFNPEVDPDDTLLVGRISDTSGACRGVIVNYACHPTTLAWQNRHFARLHRRDAACDRAERGGTAFFLQGMSGDLAPRHQYVGDVAVADRHGTQLARGVGHAAGHGASRNGACLHGNRGIGSPFGGLATSITEPFRPACRACGECRCSAEGVANGRSVGTAAFGVYQSNAAGTSASTTRHSEITGRWRQVRSSIHDLETRRSDPDRQLQ